MPWKFPWCLYLKQSLKIPNSERIALLCPCLFVTVTTSRDTNLGVPTQVRGQGICSCTPTYQWGYFHLLLTVSCDQFIIHFVSACVIYPTIYYYFSLAICFFLFLLMFEYSCLHVLTTTFPRPTHAHLPPSIPPPLGSLSVSLIHVHLCPILFFLTLFPSPLWLLSVCCWFKCLWLYFTGQFVLLISFHI